MPAKMRAALLVCLGLTAAAVERTAGLASEELPVPQPDLDPYQVARQAAEGAVQQVKELSRSIESYGSKASAKERVEDAESKAEDEFSARRQELEAQFAEYRRRAGFAAKKAEAGSWNSSEYLTRAQNALEGLKRTDESLAELDAKAKEDVKKAVHDLSDSARHQARAAEKEADHLARKARKETDHLDDVAREMDRPDAADELDRAAEDAAREVQDTAEEAARHIQDASQKAHKAVAQNGKHDAKERRKEIEALGKLVKKAARESAQSEEAAPEEAAAEHDNTSPATLLLVWASAVGGAVAILGLFARRGRSEEDLDKYLLVV